MVHNECEVHEGKQNNHIKGSNNYKTQIANGKKPSILTLDSQQLLDAFAGTGTFINSTRELVDFGKIIGEYSNSTVTYIDTKKNIIHYDSNNNAHIVPSDPNGLF